MIITKLIGGLGNQLFQYAMARRLAYIHNDQLKLDITAFRDYKLRSYYLNPFNIIEQIATDEEINALRNRHFVQEASFQFDPAMLGLGTDVYLEGYWQSEKYFQDIFPVIRREFTLRNPPEGPNLELANRIRNCKAVSVHIRRGDYVTNPATNSVHGVSPMEYYRQAVAIIAGRLGQPNFFVFSDDWGWVEHNFHLPFPMTVVSHNANWPQEDLRLMNLCKYHIIANSTLSWWGAWLAPYSDKMVIAPRKWFNSPHIHIGDLIPAGWRLI